MKRTFLIVGTMMLASLSFADDTATDPTKEVCFDLSLNGVDWTDAKEMLCTQQLTAGSNEYLISLKLGTRIVAEFHYDLVNPQEMDRNGKKNKAHYALANPENALFNELDVRFNGNRNPTTMAETGTVRVAGQKLYYKKMQ